MKDDKLNVTKTKNLQCEAFYRFRYNNETKTYFLNTFSQIYSHKAIDIQKITQPMIEDLHSFRKKRPIIDIFATPAMKTNYKLFCDVLLLDVTYKTNQYQVPLIAFSGVARDGKNVQYSPC